MVNNFPQDSTTANPVFYRTYSRRRSEGRETWQQVVKRTVEGIKELGKLTEDEASLIERMQSELKCLTSGRWLWVGGTDWVGNPDNFYGAYNCTGMNVTDWHSFGMLMDLAMMGCGTGAVLEGKYIKNIPTIRNKINVKIEGQFGGIPPEERRPNTVITAIDSTVFISVGDSRQGWVDSYQGLLSLSTDTSFSSEEIELVVDLSNVRPAGEPLKGFGGVSNPIKLGGLYSRCAEILNGAIGRQLNSVECCLLIDEAALVVVAGNVRRCLPADALVHTSNGLVPIKDVNVGDLVQTPIGFRRITNKFDQGLQDVYEIETNATWPRATLNHSVAIFKTATGEVDWKKVSQLKEGNRLLHNSEILPGTVTCLPPDFTETRPSQSHTAKSFVIPSLTSEIAWLIGYTHGNGYVALGTNKHGKPFGSVSWSMSSLNLELSNKIQEKIDQALALFGLTSIHTQIKGENTIKSSCCSIRFAEYFYRFIKQPKTNLVVPSFILQGSIDIRAAYLAGLMDSDGAINNRPPHLVTSVYKDFTRQVGVVLSSLGIAGRLSVTYPTNPNWQVKYNLKLPALKGKYNSLIALYSMKGQLKEGLKMYGFTIPGEMMRESYSYTEMTRMGFGGSRSSDYNYERYMAESEIDLNIPVSVKGIGSFDNVQTYDIEVEEAHCFYCDGYLTHNSAGLRQSDKSDELFANAKKNLWKEDSEGNWKIDPKRDALRMSNHTRVYHSKPTLEEIKEAVTSQYYSGEGAIQWAGEAVARANADLLTDGNNKIQFLEAYGAGTGKEWIKNKIPNISPEELEHRLSRYSLNPCGK